MIEPAYEACSSHKSKKKTCSYCKLRTEKNEADKIFIYYIYLLIGDKGKPFKGRWLHLTDKKSQKEGKEQISLAFKNSVI